MQSNVDEKATERVYAGFFVRLAAYLVDWLVVGAALLIVRIPFWIMMFSGTATILTTDFIFRYSVYDIVIYVMKVVYFSLLTYKTGATLGKKLFHLSVESMEDRKPTWFEIVYRESVGKFLSGLFMSIGYILIGPDKKKQGLHDHLCDTCVVYRHKKVVYVRTPVDVKTVQYRVNLPVQSEQNVSLEPQKAAEEQKEPPKPQEVAGGQTKPPEPHAAESERPQQEQ